LCINFAKFNIVRQKIIPELGNHQLRQTLIKPIALLRIEMMSRARISAVIASAITVTISLWPNLILAKDPFRASSPRNIDNNTEAAFKAIFEQGNYPAAKRYLQQAESAQANDPLANAMRASLAFTENDMNSLKTYADKTLSSAQQLSGTDPLRGNIYTAVGHFLQGSYSFQKDGALGAMNKLQQVFQYLDEAKKIAPDDPELNLLKGYMDLMLAVNLPFSDPSQAIEQLEKSAAPKYLANRGMAIGYRDLKKFDKAMDYVNRTLAETPTNPEVRYLKAQILVAQGEKEKNPSLYNNANTDFDAALAKPEQLPKSMVAQIFYERCRNQRRIDNKNRDCRGLRDKIRQEAGSWGPTKLPPLD